MAKRKTYTKKELEKILEDHKHWWNEDCAGWEDREDGMDEAD